MDLRNSSLRRRTSSKRNFTTSRFARMVIWGLGLLITILSSTTRLPIQASNTGRCAKLMGSGRSCPLPGRAMIAADSQRRSREQGELMPGDCGGPAEEGKADGDFCAVRQREGEFCTSDLSPFPTKFRVGFRPLQKVQPKN